MIFEIPHGDTIEIKTIVLDLNGTLSVKGKVPDGVKERLEKLRGLDYRIVLFTGDQRGTAKKLCHELGIELIITKTGAEKEEQILKLDPSTCAAIGNARIDIGKFKHAKISILTLQAEGLHTGAIQYADIIVPNILDALALLIDKDTFYATMRE